MTALTAALPVVTYRNKSDNTPRPSLRHWKDLAGGLTRHTPRDVKDGPAWSPIENVPGQPRGNAHVVSVSCFVADIDDGTRPADLWERWQAPDGRPLAWCLHSSYSSTPEQPKYRVVFPLAAPVPAADWPAVHRKLTLALFGDHADPACKDAARLFFLPSCPPSMWEDAFADAREGLPLDPADFPDPEPVEAAEAQMRYAFRSGPASGRAKGDTGGGRPGDDFNERGDVLGLLQTHGWQVAGERGGLTLLRRPGKSHDFSATFGYGGSRMFYCFTSSAPPFEASTGYSPFSVFALLEHNGDRSTAARALGQEGYGSPSTDYKQANTNSHIKSSSATVAPGTFTQGQEQEWPEASPLLFYGLAGEIVGLIEPHTEADPVALLVQLLAAFGSAIGRGAHFKAEADQHFSKLFVVMVGISSKGRKGTSWGHVKRLFSLADPPWEACCVQKGLSSGEGLIWHVRDAVEKPIKNKATGEVEMETVDPGVTEKRLLVLESEFASVLRVASRDGNTLSAVLRDAWDQDRLQTMTKNNAAHATGAHVSLIGHVTADELRRELSSTEAGNGFANRFLWVCTRRSKELPEGGDLQEEALLPLAGRLSAAIQEGRQAGILTRDENARALWCAVYHDLSEGEPGLSGAVTSRGEAQTMRLALLYALLDGAECIRREHLTAALALWEYVQASARYVFGDSLGDPVADDILRALRNAPDGMSRTDLQNLLGRHQASNRIGQALALLLKHGRARVVQEQTAGRPLERWFHGGTPAPGQGAGVV